MKHFGSFEKLRQVCLDNMVHGKNEDEGYGYLPDIDISVQGQEPYAACRSVIVVARSFGHGLPDLPSGTLDRRYFLKRRLRGQAYWPWFRGREPVSRMSLWNSGSETGRVRRWLQLSLLLIHRTKMWPVRDWHHVRAESGLTRQIPLDDRRLSWERGRLPQMRRRSACRKAEQYGEMLACHIWPRCNYVQKTGQQSQTSRRRRTQSPHGFGRRR